MRLRYLQTEQGTEAYTVLVQDIPGVPYGTPLHRLDNTVRHPLCPQIGAGRPRHLPQQPVRHAAAPPECHKSPHSACFSVTIGINKVPMNQ